MMFFLIRVSFSVFILIPDWDAVMVGDGCGV
jgi:hypothetical protein